MHRLLLPGSLVTRLGQGLTETYYRFVSASDRELLFVHQSADRVLGACVLSLEPATLMQRFVAAHPVCLGWQTLLRLPLDGQVRDFVWKKLTAAGRDKAPVPQMPEIVQIFVNPESQGQGIGRAVVHGVETELGRRGWGEYYLKTDADTANAAHAFYLRLGFDAGHLAHLNTQDYVYYHRRLSGENATGAAL